eukprot:CAMPEP_0170141978 /NCGR_PEP_ID=MMETSP0033_2-20121228/7343_1 /TAXON_ID=195969 /ORGANISM="Dolichomastix tenuilepis, Strain CCMP3274" /LENGTH=127 /DNA_ID=CAMNT_0010378277 /DNA_START=229 /DNA_END=613 /DNA_ORIENTATION=+
MPTIFPLFLLDVGVGSETNAAACGNVGAHAELICARVGGGSHPDGLLRSIQLPKLRQVDDTVEERRHRDVVRSRSCRNALADDDRHHRRQPLIRVLGAPDDAAAVSPGGPGDLVWPSDSHVAVAEAW